MIIHGAVVPPIHTIPQINASFPRFTEIVETELGSPHEGNIARHHLEEKLALVALL